MLIRLVTLISLFVRCMRLCIKPAMSRSLFVWSLVRRPMWSKKDQPMAKLAFRQLCLRPVRTEAPQRSIWLTIKSSKDQACIQTTSRASNKIIRLQRSTWWKVRSPNDQACILTPRFASNENRWSQRSTWIKIEFSNDWACMQCRWPGLRPTITDGPSEWRDNT